MDGLVENQPFEAILVHPAHPVHGALLLGPALFRPESSSVQVLASQRKPEHQGWRLLFCIRPQSVRDSEPYTG